MESVLSTGGFISAQPSVLLGSGDEKAIQDSKRERESNSGLLLMVNVEMTIGHNGRIN